MNIPRDSEAHSTQVTEFANPATSIPSFCNCPGVQVSLLGYRYCSPAVAFLCCSGSKAAAAAALLPLQHLYLFL